MSKIEIKELYKIAIETRNLEINLFWQRSNYFLVLNTAIAIGTFSKVAKDFQILLALLGVVVSFLWVCVNLGSKYWQVRWEYEVAKLKKEISQKISLFSADNDMIRIAVRQSLSNNGNKKCQNFYNRLVLEKPSVSKMMTRLSALFVIFWIVTVGLLCR